MGSFSQEERRHQDPKSGAVPYQAMSIKSIYAMRNQCITCVLRQISWLFLLSTCGFRQHPSLRIELALSSHRTEPFCRHEPHASREEPFAGARCQSLNFGTRIVVEYPPQYHEALRIVESSDVEWYHDSGIRSHDDCCKNLLCCC